MKLSLCLIENNAKNRYGVVQIELHIFLASGYISDKVVAFFN
jgi:hypothetical protein